MLAIHRNSRVLTEDQITWKPSTAQHPQGPDLLPLQLSGIIPKIDITSANTIVLYYSTSTSTIPTPKNNNYDRNAHDRNNNVLTEDRNHLETQPSPAFQGGTIPKMAFTSTNAIVLCYSTSTSTSTSTIVPLRRITLMTAMRRNSRVLTGGPKSPGSPAQPSIPKDRTCCRCSSQELFPKSTSLVLIL